MAADDPAPDDAHRKAAVTAQRRRHRRGILAGALALGLPAPLAATAPAAADNTAIGYPVYSGSGHPVPTLPAGFTVHRTLRAQYEADRRTGDGTDFWMDRMLARKGEDPAGHWLFTRGRAVFMKEHTHCPSWASPARSPTGRASTTGPRTRSP
ncbi:hypothetical protein [Streptomyces sp. NPDC008137]|uniref:hypothetical protein n=1 Tax=Streptomyces sp. NPDC008137 TaxID=3364813 RepID=UPI0036E80426